MLEVVETAIEEETLQALLSLVLQKLSSCSSCVLGWPQQHCDPAEKMEGYSRLVVSW